MGSHFDIREWGGKWFGLISSHFTSSQLFPHLEIWQFLLSPLNFRLIAYKIQLLNSWGLWFYVVEKSYKEDISSLFTLGQLYDH